MAEDHDHDHPLYDPSYDVANDPWVSPVRKVTRDVDREVTAREVAALIGWFEPTRTILYQISKVLELIGWTSRRIRRPRVEDPSRSEIVRVWKRSHPLEMLRKIVGEEDSLE